MNDEPGTHAPGDDDGLKTVRIAVMVTKADEKAIDDWMFARRIRHGRSEAIRQLLHLGLEYQRQDAAAVRGSGTTEEAVVTDPIDILGIAHRRHQDGTVRDPRAGHAGRPR